MKHSRTLGLSATTAWVLSVLSPVFPAASAAELWKASVLTTGGFTGGIEGPACDKRGTLYCVSYQDAGNIAEVTSDGRTKVFVSLPAGSAGNGIRFNPAGTMFVADYTGHNVLQINPATRDVSILVHDARMNQPNDLAIAEDGTLYASDPDWKRGTGQVWRITKEGKAVLEEGGLGTTNGIEVSPDGKSVYVNESIQRNLWVYDRAEDGSLSHRRLLRKFEDHGFDGMRCDGDGNLFITRPGKGTVVKVSPRGEILREVSVLGGHPTNLCFGGEDGCTVYVTEASEKRVVQFRVERPGLEWIRWHSPASKPVGTRAP